ncbi:hypothetical protein L1765_08275 [Microaerobacter geothermalis]|nr:hypothetical protein [Microaerobacter geothermalis]MCF6093967.1 hypothetical protein [Microaerobacter geothermalis]
MIDCCTPAEEKNRKEVKTVDDCCAPMSKQEEIKEEKTEKKRGCGC